jgi:toxin CcdB
VGREAAFKAEFGDWIACVEVIQSDLLDALSTRLAVALHALTFEGKVPSALYPRVLVTGQRVYALAHFAAPFPAKLLQKPVDSVASQTSALVAAMDSVKQLQIA